MLTVGEQNDGTEDAHPPGSWTIEGKSAKRRVALELVGIVEVLKRLAVEKS